LIIIYKSSDAKNDDLNTITGVLFKKSNYYSVTYSEESKKRLLDLQEEYDCCGMKNYNEWSGQKPLPKGCLNKDFSVDPMYQTNCGMKIWNYVQDYIADKVVTYLFCIIAQVPLDMILFCAITKIPEPAFTQDYNTGNVEAQATAGGEPEVHHEGSDPLPEQSAAASEA